MNWNILTDDRNVRLMRNVGLVALMLLLLSPAAFAAEGDTAAFQGLCKVAGWIKKILTGAAVIAVLMYVINSFFVKSAVVGDIIMYVIIGCALAVAVTYLIGLTGLDTASCNLNGTSGTTP